MQGQAFGQANFFSAGVSKGTEATYAGADDNAEVLLEGEGGKVATWATHLNYSKEAGHHQVVRLTEGSGRVEADGSARISWDSTFTVDYYGSLAPFTIEDPTLTVDAAGEGELTATLIGCATAMGAPECARRSRRSPTLRSRPSPASPSTTSGSDDRPRLRRRRSRHHRGENGAEPDRRRLGSVAAGHGHLPGSRPGSRPSSTRRAVATTRKRRRCRSSSTSRGRPRPRRRRPRPTPTPARGRRPRARPLRRRWRRRPRRAR